MLSPTEWKEFGESMIPKIPSLKGFLRVKEEDHLFNQLKNFDNYPVLVFVDLSSGGSAPNPDAYREINSALVFILDRAISPKEFTPVKELEHDTVTWQIAEDFKAILRNQTDGAGNPCSFLRYLNLNSIHQEPVYNYNGNNGYSIDFEF